MDERKRERGERKKWHPGVRGASTSSKRYLTQVTRAAERQLSFVEYRYKIYRDLYQGYLALASKIGNCTGYTLRRTSSIHNKPFTRWLGASYNKVARGFKAKTASGRMATSCDTECARGERTVHKGREKIACGRRVLHSG